MASKWGGVERARRGIAAVVKRLGDNALHKSCVTMRGDLSGNDFAELLDEHLDGVQIDTIVEIGTCTGLSAAVLACFAQTVVTVDVAPLPIARELWHIFTTDTQICQVLIQNDDAKIRLLERLPFQFAFVDGSHQRKNVVIDFAAVRHCGLVLFHDFPYAGFPINDGPGWLADRAVHDGNLEADPPYLWWRAEV